MWVKLHKSEYVIRVKFFGFYIFCLRKTMEMDKVRIEKLVDAENWLSWKFQVQTMLDAKDAEVVHGTWIKPEERSDNEAKVKTDQ